MGAAEVSREEADLFFGDPREAAPPERNRPRDYCPWCGFPLRQVLVIGGRGGGKTAALAAPACPHCGRPLLREEEGDGD